MKRQIHSSNLVVLVSLPQQNLRLTWSKLVFMIIVTKHVTVWLIDVPLAKLVEWLSQWHCGMGWDAMKFVVDIISPFK